MARVSNETKPTPSDLRLEIAARTARAPAPAVPARRARPRRSDEQRIAELAQRIEALRARSARPKAAARPKPVGRPVTTGSRAAQGDAFEAELRALVDDFVERIGNLLARRTLARATQILGADEAPKAKRR